MPALTSSMWAPAATWASASLLDGREVAGRHLGRELLAAGRVDALADDAERPVEADDDLLVAELTTVSVMSLLPRLRPAPARAGGAPAARPIPG